MTTCVCVCLCRHLKQLLLDVYLASFGGSSDGIEICIRATPRIEISSVEEICQLLESGVVSQVLFLCVHLRNTHET